MRRVLLVLALTSGCAAQRATTPELEPEPLKEVLALERQLLDQQQAFLDTLQVESGRDCSRLCQLAGNICALADRICRIAERHREDVELQVRCRDALSSCAVARQRLFDLCRCPDQPASPELP